MAIKVSYLDKSGKPASATFPSEAIATSYMRTLSSKANARIEQSSATVTSVTVQLCPEGTADAQREATRTYHDPNVIGYVPTRIAAAQASENRAERMAEHFGNARAAGQCMEDAWADYDYTFNR